MASQRGRNAFEMFFFLVILVLLVGAGVWFIGGPEMPAEPVEETKVAEVDEDDEPLDIEIGEGLSITTDSERVNNIIDAIRNSGEEDSQEPDEEVDAEEGGLLNNLAERYRNRNTKEETEETEETEEE